MAKQSETTKRSRYGGKESDDETGFAYYGARYYVSWLGRWTAADPAGAVDGPSRYMYARNNPLNMVDPSGREPLGAALSNEGKYAHRVTYKNMDEYVASEASSDHVVNADGTVTAIVWKKTPPTTIAPQKPAPKPAPAKPKPKPAEKPKKEEKVLSAHELRQLALACPPTLRRPSVRRRRTGSGRWRVRRRRHVRDRRRRGGGRRGRVARHRPGVIRLDADVDRRGVEDVDVHGGRRLREHVHRRPRVAAGDRGEHGDAREHLLGRVRPLLAVIAAGAEADCARRGARQRGAGTGINTGKSFIGEINCGFCTIAGADAVSMTSTEEAIAAGVSEAGHPGLYPAEFSDLLANRGLGTGVADVEGVTAADAQQFMSRFPQGTKFAIYHGWTSGRAHYVNAKVGRFGLYFINNQQLLGGFLPYFKLPPNAWNVSVWTTYHPAW